MLKSNDIIGLFELSSNSEQLDCAVWNFRTVGFKVCERVDSNYYKWIFSPPP